VTDPHEDVGAAIRAAADRVEAPPTLRTRLAADRARPRRGRRGLIAGGVAATAALAAAAVLAITGLEADPSVSDAAAVALRAPTRHGEQLALPAVGGVSFPAYDETRRWEPVGYRTDTLDGRPVVSVRYRRGGQTVGYAIVGGDQLDVPDGARRRSPWGTPVTVYTRGGATVATWRRGGRTCVLASRDTTPAELLAFVDWRA
jgi:hypothetical protein